MTGKKGLFKLLHIIKNNCSASYNVGCQSTVALLEILQNTVESEKIEGDYIDGIKNILNSNNLGSRQPMGALEWLQKLDESSPTILLLKDFHHFCEDPSILRMLKNLTINLR